MKSIKLLSIMALILIVAAGCAPTVKSSATAPDLTSLPAANNSDQTAAGSTVVDGQLAIEISGFAFTPQSAMVKVGTTVTWTNKDSATHNIKADDGSFESGPINQGESFTFQFNTPGTFPYICTVHPSMQGTITVVQ
ncbi:MAG: cupredoxin family copper-binding protein [Anaerolineaceae bacterium]